MASKIRVLHVITRLDKGGSAENTFLTLTGLDRSRYEVSLAAGPVENAGQDRKNQVEEHGIPYFYIPELVRDINPIRDPVALLKLYNLLKKKRFDIVHTHTSKAGLLGRLAAKLAKTPVIIHTPHGHVFFGYFGQGKTKVFLFLEKLASRITDRLVALTRQEKEDYVSFRVAEENRCVVIHSGIELDKFTELPPGEKHNIKSRLGIPADSLVVGTAGRLATVKGPEVLIEAARHILAKKTSVFFVFAGDGDLRPRLERKTAELGIEKHVAFLGWRDDIARILSLYDIFVLPSLNEGMGRVLAEAMALGKPIVASRVGGIPDLVIHGKNGFLVPPKNPEELATSIGILLEDSEKRAEMGKSGKAMASHFSKEKMVEKIAKLYEELLKQKEKFYFP